MKTLVLILFLLGTIPASAFAEDKAPKPAAESELVVPEKDCQYLTTYQPAANVEYEPGVDVHGKPVMEADVSPAVIKPPEKYSFDITIDAARNMGLAIPAGLESEAKMGTITVEKGQIKFNGTPLEGDAEATLKAVCAAQKAKAAPKPAKTIDRK